MLVCTNNDIFGCPALGSKCECFPWCEYLIKDGVEDAN